MKKITIQGADINFKQVKNSDFISLTDMTKGFDGGGALIEQWLRNKDTLLFLGAWEKMFNEGFNSPEFEGIKNEAGTSSYFMSVKKWTETTGANGKRLES